MRIREERRVHMEGETEKKKRKKEIEKDETGRKIRDEGIYRERYRRKSYIHHAQACIRYHYVKGYKLRSKQELYFPSYVPLFQRKDARSRRRLRLDAHFPAEIPDRRLSSPFAEIYTVYLRLNVFRKRCFLFNMPASPDEGISHGERDYTMPTTTPR